jgi:hypothetical protein
MIILDKQFIDGAAITASTEHASYKFSDAFKDSRRSRYGRTTAVDDQFIDIDLITACEVNYFAMVDDNLTATAVITLSANSVNDPLNPVVSYPITNKEWSVLADIKDSTSTEFELIDENGDYVVDELGNYISGYTSFSEYRYWRLSIDDELNADTFLKISKIFLCDGTIMPDMAKNQKLPVASTANITESPSGQAFADAGYFYKYGTINFPFVSADQKDDMEDLFRANDKYKPVLIAVWESITDEEPPIYSRITTDMEFTRVEGLTGRIYSLQFGFKEIF